MLLYFLTSVSVIVFFRRSGADTRLWNTLIAPVLGALGIAGAIWLIIANFTTLIGGDRTTAIWLQLTVPVVLILGVVAARLTRPRAADHRLNTAIPRRYGRSLRPGRIGPSVGPA